MILKYRRTDKIVLALSAVAYLIFMASLFAFKPFMTLSRGLFFSSFDLNNLLLVLGYIFLLTCWILAFLSPIILYRVMKEAPKMVVEVPKTKEIEIDTEKKIIFYGKNSYSLDDCLTNHKSITIDCITYRSVTFEFHKLPEHYCVWKCGSNHIKFYLNFPLFFYLLLHKVRFTKIDIVGYLTMAIVYFFFYGLWTLIVLYLAVMATMKVFGLA